MTRFNSHHEENETAVTEPKTPEPDTPAEAAAAAAEVPAEIGGSLNSSSDDCNEQRRQSLATAGKPPPAAKAAAAASKAHSKKAKHRVTKKKPPATDTSSPRSRPKYVPLGRKKKEKEEKCKTPQQQTSTEGATKLVALGGLSPTLPRSASHSAEHSGGDSFGPWEEVSMADAEGMADEPEVLDDQKKDNKRRRKILGHKPKKK